MKKKIFFTTGLFFIVFSIYAQNKKTTEQAVSASIAFNDKQFSAVASYKYLWNFGKKKQFQVGTGARFTSNFGDKLFYITAPAKLTSGKTGPGVFFSNQLLQNIDSIYFLKSQTNSLNISINFGYKINQKFSVGFDIDAIGFSFGKNQSGLYYGNTSVNSTTAKPTNFNLLLVSDNDLGSLNSEFFGQYNFNKKWSAKLAYQFLFTEYTTDTKVQITPSGDKNDRFRNKSSSISFGAVYTF